MRMQPVTERILHRLPGPRGAWIALWALVPWLNAGANVVLDTGGTSAVWEESDARLALNYAALSAAVVIAVVGTRRIVRELQALPASGVDDDRRAGISPFRELGGVAGPLALTAASAVAFGLDALLRDGWDAALLRGATWLVIGVALWTFLWTYGGLQLGLHRVGERHLVAGNGMLDPTLGCRPLGQVAFTGLWLLLAWLIPVLLTGTPDVIGAVVGLAVLAAGLIAFFASLFGIHRRMAKVKANEIAVARRLYAEAYAAVSAAPTLATLRTQADALGAADALERRALAIHDWPIDEGTVARLITIATSVIAVIVARMILDPFGL